WFVLASPLLLWAFRRAPWPTLLAPLGLTAVAYMYVSGAGIDPPYGALVDLARDLMSGATDVYGAADRLRSWQI
ncbi:hypothetical protein ABZW57_32160, partial [Streptomyces pseudogriseolus]